MQARHCPRCHGVFLPATDNVQTTVQCPHCAVIVPLDWCAMAQVETAPVQVYHRVTEEEEFAARRVAANRRNFAAAGIGLAILMLAGLVVFAWQRMRADPAANAREAEVQAWVQRERAAQRDRSEQEALVRRIMEAATWRDMLPDVVDADRVSGNMSWFYDYQPAAHVVQKVLDIGPWEKVEGIGNTVRVRVTTDKTPQQWLLLIKRDNRWQFDWEAWATPGRVRWNAFVREAPGTTITLRLLAARMPAPDAVLQRAGLTRETHSALALWALGREHMAVAILPKQSVMWGQLAGIDYDNALKIIADVTMLDPVSEPPLISLDRVIQTGWMWGVPAAPVTTATARKP